MRCSDHGYTGTREKFELMKQYLNWTLKYLKKGFDIQKQWGEWWLYKIFHLIQAQKLRKTCLIELIFKAVLLLPLFHGSKDEPRTGHYASTLPLSYSFSVRAYCYQKLTGRMFSYLTWSLGPSEQG